MSRKVRRVLDAIEANHGFCFLDGGALAESYLRLGRVRAMVLKCPVCASIFAHKEPRSAWSRKRS